MRQRGCAVARAVARTVGELTNFGRSRLHDEWPGLAEKFRMGGAATFEVFRGTELTWSLV